MIQTTEQLTATIQQDNAAIISHMLRDLIQTHKLKEGKRRLDLWKRYTQEQVPIQQYEYADYEKASERIPNDFYGDIVDTKAGYMGNEIVVALDKEYYKDGDDFDEAAYDRDSQWLQEWQRKNNTLDLNSEAVKVAGATGASFRLLYVDESGQTRIKNVPGYEVVWIVDGSLYDPVLALRYYTIEEMQHGYGSRSLQKIERTYVEWYDDTVVRYYIDDGRLNFSPYETESQPAEIVHGFDGIPLLPMPNNEEMRAQPEKALDLIDAYDIIMSSTTNEFIQLRMAYMALKGAGAQIDSDFMKQLEQTGVFGLPADGSAEFMSKEIQADALRFMLDELRRNIYQFSDAVDMSRDFGGDMRVIGLKLAMAPMENSAKITERKFTRAMREQYRMLTDFWRRTAQANIDPMALTFTFTRNFPQDVEREAMTLAALAGHVSDQTRLGLMSFIDDPEAELRRMEMERELYGGDMPIGDGDADEESEDAASPDGESDRETT